MTDHPHDDCRTCGHASDCATHNTPALPPGPCGCRRMRGGARAARDAHAEQFRRDLATVADAAAPPADCTCEAPPARITAACPRHGLPALHRAGRSTRGQAADLVIVDDPIRYDPIHWRSIEVDAIADAAQHERDLAAEYAAGGVILPGPWLDRTGSEQLAPEVVDQVAAHLHAGEQRIAPADLTGLTIAPPRQHGKPPLTPADALAVVEAIRPAPMPTATRDRLRQQLAAAYGVPLVDVDPARLRAELELRRLEADRWGDDGGHLDDPLDLPPLVITLRPDATAFVEGMRRAVGLLLDPFRRLADALTASFRQLANAFGRPTDPAGRRWPGDVPPRRWRDWLPATERPVDRARRQHIARQLGHRGRRAARRARITARREQRAHEAAGWYAIRDAGLRGAAAAVALRTAAAGVR